MSLWVLAALLAGGCAMERTSLTNTAVDQFPDADATLDYWDALESQSVTTNNDALHGLILFNDGDEGIQDDWEARLARAKSLGWVPENAQLDPSESAQVGMMAVAGCHILDIQGGLSMALWGRTPRFSTKELVHIAVLPGIGEHEALSGAEFIAYIDALEQRQRIDAAWKRKLSAQAGPIEPFNAGASTQSDQPEQPDEAQQAAPDAPDTTADTPPEAPASAGESAQEDDE
ncbi:MAG: hypothetical protein MK101_08180 [Phycisphaerales bacterium]|nr:hypothetical protein [Phycisphaerales bacterium]